MEVSPLVIDFLMGFGYQHSGLLPAVRTFDPARQSLLSHGKLLLSYLKEAGIFYFIALRGSQKGLKSNIYPDSLPSLRQWLLTDIITGKTGIPLTSRASSDGYHLYVTLNGTGQPELEATYVSDSEILVIKFPTRLLEGEAIIPISAFEARKASFAIAVSNPPEKALIGFVQSLKDFLKHLRADTTIFWKGCLKFGELFNLAKARNRAFILAVDRDALLKGDVVEVSTEVKPMISSLNSLSIRLNAILKGLLHLPCTTFNMAYSSKGVKP